MQVRAWIIPWYRQQDWPRWVTVCEFKGSFEEWLARAEAGAKHYESLGYNVAKVVLDPEKFVEWSKGHGGIVDANARLLCATTVFHERANE